jgi:hypothetical protein
MPRIELSPARSSSPSCFADRIGVSMKPPWAENRRLCALVPAHLSQLQASLSGALTTPLQ